MFLVFDIFAFHSAAKHIFYLTCFLAVNNMQIFLSKIHVIQIDTSLPHSSRTKSSISIDEKTLLLARSRYHCKMLPFTIFFAASDFFASSIHVPWKSCFLPRGKIECPCDAICLPLRCAATECTAPINSMFIFVGDAGQIISRDAETGAYGQRWRYEEAPGAHGETAPRDSRESSKIRG